jgi:hypothetical protein
MSDEVAEARAALGKVIMTELPALEEAIAARDFDLALEYASVVRDARVRVRSALGSGGYAAVLRAEWAKLEPRIDAALVLSPRPSSDREAARTQWTARLARGTGSPNPPAMASGTVRGKARGNRPKSATPAMAAVASSIAVEVYYPPSSGGAGETIKPRTATADFAEDPPTRRVPRRR